MPISEPIGLWRLLRPLAFRLDAERVHDLALTLAAAASALVSRLPGGRTDSIGDGERRRLGRLGLEVANPVGLAAGLDKDAVALPLWERLGFGFVEVGTVTARPQPGNPRPRLFRLPADGALLNRMGFNNAGAEAVARRLRGLRERGLPHIPVGLNIGKSRDAPASEAAADYRHSVELLGSLADYLVVNVSSPNTPGLRDLQTVDAVSRIVAAVQAANQRPGQHGPGPRPVLLKLAPDLTDEAAVACAEAALEAGCDGLVLGNTTVCLDGLIDAVDGRGGGLSGQPLFPRSTELLRVVRQAVGPEPLLIGVGGIMDVPTAAAKLAAGADLVQVYTGLIYRGPGLVTELTRALRWPGSPVPRAPA
jgi:dihydroorotate dehydrogenase